MTILKHEYSVRSCLGSLTIRQFFMEKEVDIIFVFFDDKLPLYNQYLQ